jgi:type IV secretory pathway VirB10-like protein
MRIREGVLSSHASGLTGEAVSRIAKPFETVAPVVTAVNTAPEVPPAVTPSVAAEPANQAKSSPAMIIAAIVLVLLLIAAYFAWRWYQNQQQVAVAPPTVATEAAAVTTPPTAEPPAATPAEPAVAPPAAPPAAPPPEPAPVAAVVAPPPPPAACSSEALAATKDDLSFIQACLRTTPDTEKVLAVIESAKTAKRCDVAHRLYAFKGQAGDVVIALAYAKEFDPKSFTAGCVTAADKNTALYWYDLVLARDANHAEAKERAEALRK